jgi:hypothetical protein
MANNNSPGSEISGKSPVSDKAVNLAEEASTYNEVEKQIVASLP